MILGDAVAKFQALFGTVSDQIGFQYETAPADGIGDHRDWSRAPTGDSYVIITNGGVKEEGDPFSVWDGTVEEAVAAWFDHATSFAAGKGSTLYWRERPQIEEMVRRGRPPQDGGPWAIYSRFWVAP